jgi:hypothetical protein
MLNFQSLSQNQWDLSCTAGDMGVGWRWMLEAGPYNMTGSDVCKLLITYKQKSLPSEEGNACCTIQDIFKTLNFWHVPYVTSLNGF